MKPSSPVWILSVALAATLAAAAQKSASSDGPVSVKAEVSATSRNTDLAGYKAHLIQLRDVVTRCAQHRDGTTCDPRQASVDESVMTNAGTRAVRYGWLRSLLTRAGERGKPDAESEKETVAQLGAAATRLAADADPQPSHNAEEILQTEQTSRKHLTSILQQREFRRAQKQNNTMLQDAWEAFWRWVFRALSQVAAISSRSPWAGHILLWLAIVTPCAFLLWWIFQQTRQQRADAEVPSPVDAAAPSAREWQQWLAEAEQFAGQQKWRDAVHHVYWAAISRIESRGLWPADRARTPREYLALLKSHHSLLPDLRALTRSFERIWYGNRSAAEREYREACALMEKLVAK